MLTIVNELVFDINSKHSQLPVFDKTQVNVWLLFKEAVCNMVESKLAMNLLKERCLEFFNLCDVLQLVIDRFY